MKEKAKDKVKYSIIKDIERMQDYLGCWEYDIRELKNLGRRELRMIRNFYERLVNDDVN